MTWIRKTWRGLRLIWGRAAPVQWLLRYPTVPRSAKIFALLAVAYGLMPLDLVPDFIPVLGQVDDLVLVPMLIIVALARVLHATVDASQLRTRRKLDSARRAVPAPSPAIRQAYPRAEQAN